jgi:hypothetical protein
VIKLYGFQTLHGLWPAAMASSLVLKLSKFSGEILCAHLQLGLWNGSRIFEATYPLSV